MTTAEELNAAAFKFVQGLAADLSKEDLELPGFPDTVARLHQDLADESKSVQDIVDLINSEPALAARLIKLANSAAFNASGREISDPRAAVNLVGFNVVRSTATAFAMRQLEQQEWLEPVRPMLAKIWRRSTGVAAIAHALGDSIETIRADEALAAGLFHQLGNLYLLTQAHREGLEVAQHPAWEGVTANWHPTIARSFVESWGMPAHVGTAVEQQDGVASGDAEHMDLFPRLISAAKLYDSLEEASNGAAPKVEEMLSKVLLSGSSFMDLAAANQDAIAATRQSMS